MLHQWKPLNGTHTCTHLHTQTCACKKKQRLTLKNVKQNQELVSVFANNLEQQRTWAKGKKNLFKIKGAK